MAAPRRGRPGLTLDLPAPLDSPGAFSARHPILYPDHSSRRGIETSRRAPRGAAAPNCPADDCRRRSESGRSREPVASVNKGIMGSKMPPTTGVAEDAQRRRCPVTLRSTGAELPLVMGLASLLVGADGTPWEDLDARGWEAQHRGDYAAAEVDFRAAMEMARTSGENDPRLGHSATDPAWTLYFRGRSSQAESFALQGLRIRGSGLDERHPELAEALDAVSSGSCRSKKRPWARSIRGSAAGWPAWPTPTRAWVISPGPRRIIGEPWPSA